MTVQLGQYVSYKQQPYLVVGVQGTECRIMNSSNESKLKVLVTSVTALNHKPASKVVNRNQKYLVTAKGLIISMATKRVMAWANGHGVREEILPQA